MQLHFDINLTASQQEAYDLIHEDDVKYVTLAWSRQSGKSWLMELLCIEWLLTGNRVSIAYVCRSYLLAKKVYKELLSFLPEGTYKSANGSDLTITAKDGSVLQFYSAESGNALRGNTFHYLILDEFAFFAMEQTDGTNLWFDILSPTVKVRGRKVIFVSTPLGKSNLFYEMYERGLSDEYPDYRSLRKTVYDDGLVSEAQIEDIKRSIPTLSFRQEYMVEFLDNAVTFFGGFEACYVANLSYADKGKVYIGIDFSANGEDRTVLTKVNGEGEVWQSVITGSLDMRYQRIAQLIDKTKNLQSCFYEDNSIGAPMANEISKLLDPQIRRRFVAFTTSNASKDKIVSKLAVDIANEDLMYGDPELYNELANFQCHYSKSGKPTYGGANGVHDDRVMSLAIANHARNTVKRESSIAFARAKFDELT